MDTSQLLTYQFEEIRSFVPATVRGLDADALTWRPDTQANSIAWLVWHLTRVQDDHVSELADQQQVWASGGWADQFGLASDSMETGFGHSSAQVAAISPGDTQVLVSYHDEVTRETIDYVSALDDTGLERVIDRSYDPPVTVGVRLASVISDALQHAGQAAYVRGLWERRT